MADISQGNFARFVRGGDLDIDRIPLHIRSMWSCASAAAKRVHRESVDEARDYLEGALAKYMGGPDETVAQGYLASFERYVQWDATAAPAEAGVQPKIDFAPDGKIRGRSDIIFPLGVDQFAGRLLLWDDLPMDRNAAEIIALPSLRAVEERYGAGVVPYVEIWQLGTGQRERVSAAEAVARDDDVHQVLRQLDQ